MARGSLSTRLRFARICKGLSASALDAAAGISRGHTRQIESGRKPNPEAVTASKLARALGVDLAWLVDGTGEPPRKSTNASTNASTKPAA